MTRGIDAAAIYLPQYRITSEEISEAWGQAEMRGIEQKTVAAADEDAVTMAVAAGERVLAARDPSTIETVAIATTSPPLAEDAIEGRVIRALGLEAECETLLATGSTLAGAQALAHGLDTGGSTLVLIADCPRGDVATSDHALGAGAAAFVITDEASAPVIARGSYADERPGVRYRPEGTDTVEQVGITGYERGSVRAAVSAATEASGGEDVWGDVDGLALHQPDGGLPYRMSGSLPVEDEAIHAGTVVGETGDLGTATVAVGLAKLLDDEGVAAACSFGGGSAMAFVFEGAAPVDGLAALEAGEELTYTSYLRMREHLGSGEVDGGGARVSLPNWQRSIPQRYRLEAGECEHCGALNFPPGGACQRCHELTEYTPHPLPFEGTVEAVTVIGQGGAPPEFANQQRKSGAYAAAIVSLGREEDVARIPAQVVDCDPGEVDVGDAVRATFRRIYTQEGIVRYGRKFVQTG